MGSLISAGFYLLRPSPCPEQGPMNLLPQQIISASDCLCPQFPGAYAIEWTVVSEEQQAAAFDTVSLPPAKRPEAVEWATRNFQKSFGWPGVFYCPEEAIRTRDRFFPGESNIQVVGLGLPDEFVEAFLMDAAPRLSGEGRTPQGEPGAFEVVKRRQPLPEGPFLGFELLNVEHGEVWHSWLCYGLEVDFAVRMDVQPNEQGLLPDLQTAKRCCEAMDKEEVIAGSDVWLPWGLVRYG